MYRPNNRVQNLPAYAKSLGVSQEAVIKVSQRGKKTKTDLNLMGTKYLKRNDIYDLTQELRSQTEVTGCGDFDYAFLHNFIKVNRPQYFLECGTGISTHVIANAMQKYCYKKYDGNIKLVSMEDDPAWYSRAIQNKPEFEFVDMTLSPIKETRIMFFQGTIYKDIPIYPYSCVFIDGPSQNGMCNAVLPFLLFKGIAPLTAIIDCRILTVMAYSLFFGMHNVTRHGFDFFTVGPMSGFSEDLSLEVQERMFQQVVWNGSLKTDSLKFLEKEGTKVEKGIN